MDYYLICRKKKVLVYIDQCNLGNKTLGGHLIAVCVYLALFNKHVKCDFLLSISHNKTAYGLKAVISNQVLVDSTKFTYCSEAIEIWTQSITIFPIIGTYTNSFE
ncbi:hypothetical protein RF11_10995 [Thelohanellus kitauei]|uniref:Uncharacterized protein n=1 Tax=Thelohanellus kitauei TaxID=669202 RepID=A0A0C2JZ23_THEKT|nr:hypothetical protein RF11_10995 [Thelohanellus kitauei]